MDRPSQLQRAPSHLVQVAVRSSQDRDRGWDEGRDGLPLSGDYLREGGREGGRERGRERGSEELGRVNGKRRGGERRGKIKHIPFIRTQTESSVKIYYEFHHNYYYRPLYISVTHIEVGSHAFIFITLLGALNLVYT